MSGASTAAAEPFLFGPLRLDQHSLASAADAVCAWAREERPALVVTPNIHHLRLAGEDEPFARLLASADLSVADGAPLVLASRLRGRPLPGRVAGIDLVDRVLTSGTRLRLAILGGPPGAAEGLAERERPRHEVVLVDPLPPGRWEGSRGELAERLREARPTLTLVGIGAPRQERLAAGLRDAVAGPIVSCGAAIEVLAGVRRRAPGVVQAVGLEWAFRALLEPKRLGPRYVRAGAYYLRVLSARR